MLHCDCSIEVHIIALLWHCPAAYIVWSNVVAAAVLTPVALVLHTCVGSHGLCEFLREADLGVEAGAHRSAALCECIQPRETVLHPGNAVLHLRYRSRHHI